MSAKGSRSSLYRAQGEITRIVEELSEDAQQQLVQDLIKKNPLFQCVIGTHTDHAANEFIVHNLNRSIAQLRVPSSTWEMKQQATVLLASSVGEELPNSDDSKDCSVTLASVARALGVDSRDGITEIVAAHKHTHIITRSLFLPFFLLYFF